MVPPIARRFVAGETAAEALEHVRVISADGIGGIVNLLGEHYTDRSAVEEDTQAYLDLCADIARTELPACVSVKPTQLGLDLGEALFREQLGRIVDAAADGDVFVWLDMEGSGTTEPTVAAFEAMAAEYPHGVGVCLQSNLRRTARDIERTADVPGKIRLVKGAYREPEELAYTKAQRVNEAFRGNLESLVRLRADGIAIGTHDPDMLAYASQLKAVHDTPIEYQFLMGVNEEKQCDLTADYPVYQYVPYGPRWFAYFRRRAMERSENLVFALRAILNR